MYLGDGLNLRGCECRKDWASLPPAARGKCNCENECAAHVDPVFLTAGKGQGLCQLDTDTGYNCQVGCDNDGEPRWMAGPCGGPDAPQCDPRIVASPKAASSPSRAPPPPSPSSSPQSALDWDPFSVYDLRGLNCELLDNAERCFFEDAQGREVCPEHVTKEWLTAAESQHLCQPAQAASYYCIVGCQDGNPEVRWGANEVAWCSSQGNNGGCSARPTREFCVILKSCISYRVERVPLFLELLAVCRPWGGRCPRGLGACVPICVAWSAGSCAGREHRRL